MTEIQPTFDPVVGLWVYGSFRAPTIRELLTRMPSGTRVADYFPSGREVSSGERGFCVSAMRDENIAALRPKMFSMPPPKSQRAVAEFVARKTHERKMRATRPYPSSGVRLNAVDGVLYDRDKILEWWQNGMSHGDIAIVLGASAKPCTVLAMISIARQKNDPRAWYSKDPRRVANRVRRLTA